MPTCPLCGFSSSELSMSIQVCVKCIRSGRENSSTYSERAHYKWREKIGLSPVPPRGGYVKCSFCINECEIPDNGFGFCGVVRNKDGRLSYITGGWNKAILHWYLDPHPTNCVAAPVCPATTSHGYPKYTYTKGVERGYYNLAIFFGGCNLDCLFCQNIEHKYLIARYREKPYKNDVLTIDEMYRNGLDPKITCICYFGGDPTPNITYAIRLSERFVDFYRENNLLKRICWETNGLENPAFAKKMARLSLETGGIFKIDWKAYNPRVYHALTGVDGEKALERLKENVRIISDIGIARREIPLLVVSTLVIPHYIDEEEISSIASYLAKIDPEIPYVLLAFSPQHLMCEMPTTSRIQMNRVYNAALEAGLKNIYIGNMWLLR